MSQRARQDRQHNLLLRKGSSVIDSVLEAVFLFAVAKVLAFIAVRGRYRNLESSK